MSRQAANQLSQQQQLTVSDADSSAGSDVSASAAANTRRSGPLARYLEQVEQLQIIDDGAQHQAVQELQRLYQQLTQLPQMAQITSTQQLSHAHPVCQGIYMWGDVGRGKTYLMDLFFQCLESESNLPTLRLHFHRFMARIHKELIGESGKRDPLKRIAKRVALECRVLCFDEFFVSDIGDAMILAKLFEALFEQGIILVATSNIPIDELYKNGLQRQRFLPTIDLLNRYTQELHLSGEQDHRLHQSTHSNTATKPRYFVDSSNGSTNDSNDKLVLAQFEQVFNRCSQAEAAASVDVPLLIHGRIIDTIKYNQHVAWFEFDALCDGPRSQLDYIEIASRFSTVILTQVPVLGGEPRSWIKARGTEDGAVAIETGNRQLSYAVSDDPARRFISLVDELYDQGVELYIQAQVPMDELYSGGALSFEFRRTLSRLTQIQSLQY